MDAARIRTVPAQKRPAASNAKRAARESELRACSMCGRMESAPPGGAPVGWTVSFEAKRVTYLCADCSRANLRSIEGRLSTEWWE